MIVHNIVWLSNDLSCCFFWLQDDGDVEDDMTIREVRQIFDILYNV